MENTENKACSAPLLEGTAELIVDDTCIAVPIGRYVELIRAETELAVLEAVIADKERAWVVDDVYKAIQKARERRGDFVYIGKPAADPDPKEEEDDA